MQFELELKAYIKKKYGSIRAFSQAIEIPYSTIDNIFKRGIMGVSVNIVLKICSDLNIDIDKIQNDELILKQPELYSDKLLERYKILNDLGRQKVDEYIDDLLENPKYTEDATKSNLKQA